MGILSAQIVTLLFWMIRMLIHLLVKHISRNKLCPYSNSGWCLPIIIDDYLWSLMNIAEYIWISMNINECQRVTITTISKHLWISIHICEYHWISMTLSGHLWISMNIIEYLWISLNTMKFNEYQWILLHINGTQWISMNIDAYKQFSMIMYDHLWLSNNVHVYFWTSMNGNEYQCISMKSMTTNEHSMGLGFRVYKCLIRGIYTHIYIDIYIYIPIYIYTYMIIYTYIKILYTYY